MNTYIVTFRYATFELKETDSDMAVIRADEALGLEEEDRGPLESVIIVSDNGRTGDELLVDEDGKALHFETSLGAFRHAGIDMPEVRVIGRTAIDRRHQKEVDELLAALYAEEEMQKALKQVRKAKKPQLPPRRARGMSLSYEDGDLFVVRGKYSASLSCALNEGELHDNDGRFEPMLLSSKDMAVIEQWAANEDKYYEVNGWVTWEEANN